MGYLISLHYMVRIEQFGGLLGIPISICPDVGHDPGREDKM